MIPINELKNREKTQSVPFNIDRMTRKQAAEYLGLQRHTLAVWACTGRHKLPFVKIGRIPYYRKSDLDAFISENTKGA